MSLPPSDAHSFTDSEADAGRLIARRAQAIVFALVAYRLAYPAPTAELPLTTWQETMASPELRGGFAYLCLTHFLLGTSVGVHGVYWHFTTAPLQYRTLLLGLLTPALLVVFTMQKQHAFIASPTHFGVISGCVLAGLLIGTAIESLTSSSQGPSRFETTLLRVSIATIGAFWGGLMGNYSNLLTFDVSVPHNMTLSISLLGVFVGWAVASSLDRWVARRRRSSERSVSSGRAVLVGIGCIALLHVMALNGDAYFSLMHELALVLFGMPAAVVTGLTGIHAGVSRAPQTVRR